jgi:hypothetical protein
MFVLVDFGDNDFGHPIHEGLKEVYTEGLHEMCPTIIKQYIIAHVVGYSLKRHAEHRINKESMFKEMASTYDWLSRLRVTVEDHKPEPNANWGDASYGLDCDTGYTWFIGWG